MSAGRDLPWLQDLDVDSNGANDVRDDLWESIWRDVVILDREGVLVERYNLTTYNLAIADNYNTLGQKLIDAAFTGWQNSADRFDVDADGIVNSLDLLHIIRDLNENGNRVLPASGVAGTHMFVDVNGDGIANPLDLIQVIRQLNAIADDSPEGEAAEMSQPAETASVDEITPEPLGLFEVSNSNVGTVATGTAVALIQKPLTADTAQENDRNEIRVTPVAHSDYEAHDLPSSDQEDSPLVYEPLTYENMLSAHDFLFATLH